MTYDDDTRLTIDYTPPPAWWSDEVQQATEAGPTAEQLAAWAAAEGVAGEVLYPEDVPEEVRWEPCAGCGKVHPYDYCDSVTDEQGPPTRDQAAQRLVVIAALEQLVKRLKAEHREQAAGVYDRAHMKDPVLLDGRELGQARTDAVKAAWKVADKGKWLAYVTKFAPAHLVEVTTTEVDPTWQASVLKQLLDLKGQAWFVDPDTGEQTQTPPPASGLEYTPPGHKLVVVPAKDAAAQVAQMLGPVAQQLGLPELEAE